jgi:tRNA pseudouridine32 synthase/23S rRNA pseudouridine746 synthase
MSSRAPFPSWVVVPPDGTAGGPVVDFLSRRFPRIPRETWLRRIADGAVTDDAGVAVCPDTACRPGLRLRYYREVEAEPAVDDDVRIVFRDERLLVTCKPHGLPVTPGGGFVNACLLARVREGAGAAQAVPLHRLDRDTAGLVMFSLDPPTRGRYQRAFALGAVRKFYEAVCRAPADAWDGERVVDSRIEPDTLWFRSREADGPVNARTRVRLLERRGGLARFALEPLTGKRHQLRLHMARRGAPIVNDMLYPDVRTQAGDTAPRPPLQLLARRLAFEDPVDGRPREFASSRGLAAWTDMVSLPR